MAKVDVKLTHPTFVHGRIREAGEIVEMDPKIAAEFGEVQGIEIPAAAVVELENKINEINAVQPGEVVKREKRAKKSED